MNTPADSDPNHLSDQDTITEAILSLSRYPGILARCKTMSNYYSSFYLKYFANREPIHSFSDLDAISLHLDVRAHREAMRYYASYFKYQMMQKMLQEQLNTPDSPLEEMSTNPHQPLRTPFPTIEQWFAHQSSLASRDTPPGTLGETADQDTADPA